MEQKCPACQKKAILNSSDPLNRIITVRCDTCGVYTITEEAIREMTFSNLSNQVASWLFYHKRNHRTKNNYNIITVSDHSSADVNDITLEHIKNWMPRFFIEKVDKFLTMVYESTSFLGYQMNLSDDEMASACFGIHNLNAVTNELNQASLDQNYIFVKYLISEGYLDHSSDQNSIVLAPKGLQRVDELQKNNPNNRDVFMAMDFDDDYSDIANAIKDGITKAGYNPIFMKELIHNKQIVPMMFRLIRESRLLVMDATHPNLGAYHEAGYASGLAKEVIITCREDEFNNPDNKPHFDIAQKQILVWKDYEDLTVRLSEWIRAIAG